MEICRYLKGWFLIDFLSIVPIELIVLLIAEIFSLNIGLGNDVKLLALMKLPRLLRLGRLLKFLEGVSHSLLLLPVFPLSLFLFSLSLSLSFFFFQ